MNTHMSLSDWQNTSTAFGNGKGCNFRVRVASSAESGEALQNQAFVLSRKIDHVDLEGLAFFKTNPSTLENIARFLWREAPENIGCVEIEDGRGFSARYGRIDSSSREVCELILTFRSRTLRRVLDFEVIVRGTLNTAGHIIEKSKLTALVAKHFDLGRGASGEQRKSLEKFFVNLGQDLVPQRFICFRVRDSLQKNVVFELHSFDTSLDQGSSLPPHELQPEW